MSVERCFGLSLDNANKSEQERDFRATSWNHSQCSEPSQVQSQDNFNNCHQFLSLYKIAWNGHKTELHIYDTEKEREEVKILETDLILDQSTIITQLQNGELFCYDGLACGITLIIDRSYRVRMLPSGSRCLDSSALYFDNNIYCFGGLALHMRFSKKFDLNKNRWIDLAAFPKIDLRCHSVIFHGNILISGCCSKNLWLYSIEIDSFSIIPYEFVKEVRKVLISVDRLYLIEWDKDKLIYESEDEYNWKPISKSGDLQDCHQMYNLYNKEKIYISTRHNYYVFDLKKKVGFEFKV